MAEGRSIHDWQSDQPKKAKPYQKQEQFPKPYQKDKQWVQDELPFTDKPWRQKPLTDTEVEGLFWRKLVQLGWRISTYISGSEEKKNIVLPCPQCNLRIDQHIWDWLHQTDAEKISTAGYVNEIIKNHEPDCKAIPEACYKCQGEGILQSGEECDC
jgi:hypothetical protein